MDMHGPKISRKGTRPAGQVPSKRYSSCFDFHSSIIQSIQTESLKRDTSYSNFGRLLELMPAFLSGIRYNFRWNFICLTDLSTSRNTVCPPVM